MSSYEGFSNDYGMIKYVNTDWYQILVPAQNYSIWIKPNIVCLLLVEIIITVGRRNSISINDILKKSNEPQKKIDNGHTNENHNNMVK